MVLTERILISDDSRVKKICLLASVGPKIDKMSGQKLSFIIFVLPKLPEWPTDGFGTQCFQIWQVSARYCTFLDFLAHCCGKTDSECQTFLEKTLIVQPAEEFSGETAAQVD